MDKLQREPLILFEKLVLQNENSIKGIQIGFEILKEYKSSVLFSIVLSIATGVIAGAGFSVLLPILTLDSLSTSVSFSFFK